LLDAGWSLVGFEERGVGKRAVVGQQALENQRQIQALLVQWEQETVKELLEPEAQ
jgi:hypothetical protein